MWAKFGGLRLSQEIKTIFSLPELPKVFKTRRRKLIWTDAVSTREDLIFPGMPAEKSAGSRVRDGVGETETGLGARPAWAGTLERAGDTASLPLSSPCRAGHASRPVKASVRPWQPGPQRDSVLGHGRPLTPGSACLWSVRGWPSEGRTADVDRPP